MEVIKTRRDTDHGDLPTETVAYFLPGTIFKATLVDNSVDITRVSAVVRIYDKAQYPTVNFFAVDAHRQGDIQCGWISGGTVLYWYSGASRVFLNADASTMFDGFISCHSIDLTGINTGNVEQFTSMFGGCDSLETLDLSGFSTTGAFLGSLYYMFAECSSLRTIWVSDTFYIGPDMDTDSMFDNCTSLVGGNGTHYSSAYTDGTYARIDRTGSPGYFTYKAAP